MYENNVMSPADMAAVMGNHGYNGDGFGAGNGSLWTWWVIILFMFAMNGGWGNGFGGGNQIPYWMMNQNTGSEVQRGFDQNAVMNGITGINNALNTGFGNVQTALCSGFANVNQGMANGFAQAEIAANSRQMADMNQMFGFQTAVAQGQNAMQAQIAQACGDSRLASEQLRADISRENCADREALNYATNNLSNTFNTGIQRLSDKIDNYVMNQKDETIAQLRSELMYSRGQASQDVRTAAIQAGQRALANEVEQYINPTPRPSYIVPNPYCCQQNYGCGCGYSA